MDLGVGQALVGSLLLTAALVALHLAAPRIRRLPLVPERATGSFGGGLAVCYVFLHLLPEIAEGNAEVGELLESAVQPTPLTDLGIFTVALAGFTGFLGLERLTARQGSPGGPGAGTYGLHLAAFAVYNALITYTMALRLRTGVGFAVLFTVAMGLHFVLTDRGLERCHPRRFGRSGRVVLAAALLAGWLASALLAPTSALVVALLTAALGGSVLLNVMTEELPSGPRSSFGWFCTGMVLYAGLLAGVTALGG